MKLYLILFWFIFGVLGCTTKKKYGDLSKQKKNLVFDKKTVIINDIIDLNESLIELKNKQIIIEKNGLLQNGALHCINCRIIAPGKKVFENITLLGDWSGNEASVEWYLGDNVSDPILNFKILEILLNYKFAIRLHQKIQIQTPTSEYCSNPSRNLIFKGNNAENCGLILKTKHKNVFYNYFRADKGFNLVLDNICIVTEDFEKGIHSINDTEYFFTGSYYQDQFNPNAKPSIDSLIIKNCIFKGNVAIASYGSHSNNQNYMEFSSINEVKNIIITNNTFDNSNSPFAFSNMGFDNILILDNIVKNFNSAFISIPESGIAESYYDGLRKNKGHIIMNNNVFKNDRVVKVKSERILSPCVIKGGFGSMEFHGNTIENLLSNSKDADVHTFYYTCESPGFFSVKNNKILNVVGRGSISNPASLVKQRWANQFYMENNFVKIEKEALLKIGVINNINDDLSKIKGEQFYCDFFQIGGQRDFTKIFHVKGNTFIFPIMNKSTEIFDMADFRFENNRIIIDYFGPADISSTVSQNNAFFLGRERLDRQPLIPPEYFISLGNFINIKKTGKGILKYIDFPDGVQINQKNIPDKNYNYKIVQVKDTFLLNYTGVEMSLPDGEEQEYKPIIYGYGNAFYLKDFANSNHLRPNAKKLSSDILIDQTIWNQNISPFVLTPNSSQLLKVKKHSGNEIPVFNYIYFQSLFNMANEQDLVVQLLISAKDKNGKIINGEYFINLNQKDRSILFEGENEKFEDINPSDVEGKNIVIKPYSILYSDISVIPNLILERGDKHLKEAKIIFTNCSGIDQYTLKCVIASSGFQKINKQEYFKIIKNLKNKKIFSE